MPSAYPARNDNVRAVAISPGLRRALVFALLGPVLGVLVTLFVATVANGGYPLVPLAYLFSLVICAIVGPADGILASAMPTLLRVPFTAFVGAAVAVGLSVLLGAVLGCGETPSLLLLMPVAVIGALTTGACSLLAHNYRA